jgi:hypothetical protein
LSFKKFIFAALKKIAYILSFIFLSFVSGPTIISLIDDSVDISFAFTVNEEENSSKNLVSFESVIEENYSNHASIEYLKTHEKEGYSYSKNYHQVYLEVVSPPPRHI